MEDTNTRARLRDIVVVVASKDEDGWIGFRCYWEWMARREYRQIERERVENRDLGVGWIE